MKFDILAKKFYRPAAEERCLLILRTITVKIDIFLPLHLNIIILFKIKLIHGRLASKKTGIIELLLIYMEKFGYTFLAAF